MPVVRPAASTPSNETKSTCAAFACRVMPATVSSTLGRKGEVVGVTSAVEEVVAAAVVSAVVSVDGALVVVRAGSAHAAASATTSRSSIRLVSRPFFTRRA